MKCEICGREVETTFLGKIRGNYVRANGKTHLVCNSCFKVEKNTIKETLSNK